MYWSLIERQKAFHCVNEEAVCFRVLKEGISKRMVEYIKRMYDVMQLVKEMLTRQ